LGSNQRRYSANRLTIDVNKPTVSAIAYSLKTLDIHLWTEEVLMCGQHPLPFFFFCSCGRKVTDFDALSVLVNSRITGEVQFSTLVTP
jgi:hypothetical protein